MATSGNKTVKVTDWDSLKFSWNESSQDIAKNTTKISWKLQLIATDYGYIDSSISKKWNVTVNGTKYSGTNTVGIANNTTKTLASGTTTIKHNTDGTKKFSYSFNQEFGITFSGAYIGTISGNSTGTLDTIPRASSITCSTGYVEGDMTITIKRASSSFTHTITYEFGGLTSTLASKTDKTTLTWQGIPATFYAKMPNSKSKTGVMTCKTYNGNILIGTTEEEFTIKTTKAKCEPTLSPYIQDAGAASTELTGDTSTAIKGFNWLVCHAGAVAKNSATIKEIKVTNGNTTLIGDGCAFDNATSNKFTFTVTDSRDYSVSQECTISMINYVPINVAVKAIKLTADGTLTFALSGACYSGSFGAVENDISIEYRITGKGVDYPWVQVADSITAKGSFTKNIELTGLDYQKTYSVNLRWSDSLNETSWTGGATVSCIPAFDWGESSFQHNTPTIYANGANNSIFGTKSDGTLTRVLEPCNDAGNTTLGYGNYYLGQGNTGIYGNQVYLTSKAGVVINGRQYGANKILWSGTIYMQATQTAKLSETVAAQPNGIVLVFSYYGSSGAENKVFQSFFIPKSLVTGQNGAPHSFFLANTTLSMVATKYLYIYNDKITGHENNDKSGTGTSGIKYDNTKYVLRWVIGV